MECRAVVEEPREVARGQSVEPVIEVSILDDPSIMEDTGEIKHEKTQSDFFQKDRSVCCCSSIIRQSILCLNAVCKYSHPLLTSIRSQMPTR